VMKLRRRLGSEPLLINNIFPFSAVDTLLLSFDIFIHQFLALAYVANALQVREEKIPTSGSPRNDGNDRPSRRALDN